MGAKRVLLLALAGLACAHDVYREEPSRAPAPRGAPALRVLVFGDFGRRTTLQTLSARAMRRENAARPFDLALELGDNLYYCGPDPTRPSAAACRFAEDGAAVAGAPAPDDPIFSEENEAALAGLRRPDGAPVPVFVALGNHDIGWGGGVCLVRDLSEDESARRRACVEVARRSDAWSMPARHYVLDRGPVRVVVVDTNVVVADYGGFTLDGEVEFVRRATADCGPGRLCFLAGHHPPAAAFGYPVNRKSPFAPRMARLVGAAGGRARAFFGGHVHALEHLSLGDLDVFISGSNAMGGFMRMRHVVPARAVPRFATDAWGFAILEVDGAGAWSVRFHDLQGEPLYCCAAAPAGSCRPVDCN